MPANKPKRPAVQPVSSTTQVGDPNVSQALEAISASVRSLEKQRRSRSTFTADLVVGDNVLAHHLGRMPSGYTLTPTVADASFAHAMKAANDKTLTISVVGVGQPGAVIEAYAGEGVA